jgi:2-amino-4-hydroxy-6-hydroxymethyldihydropteridine diphosphokinase
MREPKAHATRRPSSLTHHPSSIPHHPSALSPQPSYFNRPIDIDILLYDDWKVSEPDLKIPHPLMHQRDFVMIPLKEIMTEQTNP